MVEFVDVVGLFHAHVILAETVHDVSQIAVDGREDSHSHREVACPEKRLSLLVAESHDVSLVVLFPSRASANHFHSSLERAQNVVVGSIRVGKLYGNIGRSKGLGVEVVLVVDVDDAHDFVSSLLSDALNHVPHLSVSY